MYTIEHNSFGGGEIPPTIYYADVVCINTNIHSEQVIPPYTPEWTDEDGTVHYNDEPAPITVWYADSTYYTKNEYIQYLESVLESRQEETDELIAEILEGD